MSTQERPFDLLNKSLGQQVMIRLKNGTDIRGRITSFDAHMNIVIDSAEEIEDGNLKTKLGTILLRGGNILFISPA
jgi:small nuclear ribonucleoprotein